MMKKALSILAAVCFGFSSNAIDILSCVDSFKPSDERVYYYVRNNNGKNKVKVKIFRLDENNNRTEEDNNSFVVAGEGVIHDKHEEIHLNWIGNEESDDHPNLEQRFCISISVGHTTKEFPLRFIPH